MAFVPAKAEAAYSSNVIPVMNGYTNPSGVVSASEEYSYFPVWQALDGDPDTYWGINSMDGWLEYTFDTPKVITKYSFNTRETMEPPFPDYFGTITHVELHAYDEDTHDWVVLNSQNPLYQGYDVDAHYAFEVNNQKAYKKYRFYIQGVDYGSSLLVSSLEMYETLPFDIATYNTTYIQSFELGTPKKVNRISFNLNNTGNTYLPTSCNIEGYNETSSQWEIINYNGAVAFGGNQLILNNSIAYKKYRVNLSFNQASSVSLTGLTVYGTD